MSRFSPAEIELEFADGAYLFRLPCTAVAEVQEACGSRVTYPDGSSGKRPKPLGAIWREHFGGLLSYQGKTVVDHAQINFNPLDSREIILKALAAGGRGTVKGEPVTVDRVQAKILVEDHVDTWPISEVWKFATAILGACCEGYAPPDEGADPPGKKKAATTGSSSSTSPPPPGA